MEEEKTNSDESESYECLECGADVKIDDRICPKCGADISEIEEEEQEEFKEEYQFKTLLGYGKFISGFGWLVVILSVLAIIIGLASGGEEAFTVAGGAIFVIILGIGMVISGQVISCFVSIEKNTRATYELLKEKQI